MRSDGLVCIVIDYKFFYDFGGLGGLASPVTKKEMKGTIMENNTELVRLEEFVDKLLTKYNQLKTDYHALQETLRERDAECAGLKNNVFDLSTEKTEVGNRVSGLLDRIQQWETEQGEELGGKGGAYGSSIQGTLFSDESEGKNS